MKIDLHVHAKERSGCSIASERDLIESARARQLDALVFTDHGRLVPENHLVELNREFAPFRIFSGVEIHTAEEEDVLVYGIHDSRLESAGWNYADLHRFVRSQAGYITLAHPFRYRDTIEADIRRFPPDAIEARSLNIPSHAEGRIRRLAEDLGCAVLYSSDAHTTEGVGAFHICLDSPADSDATLIALLRARTFVCCAL